LFDAAAEERLRLICSYRSMGVELKQISELLDRSGSERTGILRRRLGGDLAGQRHD
jgi:DNA-binding transcriptional MerR regulator